MKNIDFSTRGNTGRCLKANGQAWILAFWLLRTKTSSLTIGEAYDVLMWNKRRSNDAGRRLREARDFITRNGLKVAEKDEGKHKRWRVQGRDALRRKVLNQLTGGK